MTTQQVPHCEQVLGMTSDLGHGPSFFSRVRLRGNFDIFNLAEKQKRERERIKQVIKQESK